ncbi:MAG: MMPL family transporter [Gammaproteobacteria bacterium]|nr:MMPL family transporter [Gammaproteobacteria bacterium]
MRSLRKFRFGPWLLLAGGLLLSLSLSLSDGFRIETGILDMLPKQQQSPTDEWAGDQLVAYQAHMVVLFVEHPDPGRLSEEIRRIESFIDDSGILAQRQVVEEQRFLVDLYSSFGRQLISPDDRRALVADPAALTETAMANFFSPFSGISPLEYSADPALLLRGFIQRQDRTRGLLTLRQGRLWSLDASQPGILLPLTLTGDPFSIADQDRLLGLLEQLEDGWPDFEISYAGTAIYAGSGSANARSEVTTIGLGSLVGIIILVLYVFRSGRPLLIITASILLSVGIAASLAEWIFGSIHIFALVFGACLTGVAVDYSFHYFAKQYQGISQWNPRETLKEIFPAITFGMLSSVAAYLMLAVAPFPALRQAAVVSAIGLLVAYLIVVVLYPAISVKPGPVARGVPWASVHIVRFWCKHSPRHRILFSLILLLCLLPALPFLHSNDNIRALQTLDTRLMDMEAKIRELTGLSATQRYFVVHGESSEALLRKESALASDILGVDASAVVIGAASFVPPYSEQHENYTLYRRTVLPMYADLLSQAGFNDVYTKSRMVQMSEQEFVPLTLEEWLASPASLPWRFLWLGVTPDGDLASILLLESKTPSPAFAQVGNGQLIDRADQYSRLFALYRERISVLLMLAYGVIFLMLHLRYPWSKAMAIAAVPAIAATATLAFLAIAGIAVNLFHVLALVLVTGIGIDYSLFFAECTDQPESTLLAVAMSSATTLLSFGLLSLSTTPAVQAVGVTVCVGITVAYVLGPLPYMGSGYRQPDAGMSRAKQGEVS